MAIYKRTYSRFTGKTTPRWSRFLILLRYSYSRLFQSKFLILFLGLCLAYPIGCLAFIYIAHNPTFISYLNMRGGTMTIIDGRFFYYFCVVQGVLAYLLTALVGPSLISPDLANGGLPLYFCRPFSRLEYVAGKSCVLLVLLSLITWIPGILLYLVNASLAGWDWLTSNLWLGNAIIFGLLIWIAVITLIALACSAWVKWKIAAGGLVLGVFFAGAGFGTAINGIMRTSNGSLIDLSEVIHTIWSDLLRYDIGSDLAVRDAWLVLLAACVISAWLLARRVRAFEVVK